MTEPALKGRNLVKRYGKVTAIDHSDFDLYPGEILAVIGDNGAGKSTIIKAMSGAVIPDSGEIYLNGPIRYPAWLPATAPASAASAVVQSVRSPPAAKAPPASIRSEAGTGSARQLRKVASIRRLGP
jgi:fructose transport system ATP-binding protein